MKFLALYLTFLLSFFFSFTSIATTQKLEIGCGWSDEVFSYVVATMNEKAKMNLPLKAKGNETGRRLFIYNDSSWFLTLEFFSEASAAEDVSCIVGIGKQNDMESALDFPVEKLPDWKWGKQ